MKKPALLLILALLLGVAWAATAEQILKSADVMAYILDSKVAIMDVNTGNEVKVKTSTDTEDLLWDKTGQHLYRMHYTVDENSNYHIWLYEINLPALMETALADFSITDTDLSRLKLAMGVDGNIYFIKTDTWTNQEGTSRTLDTSCGYYDLVQAKFFHLEESEGLDEKLYTDPLHKEYGFKGYELENILMHDEAYGNHYEIFAVNQDQQDDPNKVSIIQLSRYLYLEGAGWMHLHPKKLDYQLSPDTKKMLVTYHYYFSDNKSDFNQTFLYSLDAKDMIKETVTKELYDEKKNEWVMTRYNGLKGQISLLTGEVLSQDKGYWYEWTKDNRLIYCKESSLTEEKTKICINGLLLLEKPLKTYKGSDYAFLYYRYTE